MDPNSSPWAYAYNRIVPSAPASSDEFQHPHLASISAAAGSSAQSLLLQAAHSSIAGFNATSGNFVPPNPIGGYNPVFQQIYHHAAQAAVQPKPAHYASSAVSSSHRQISSIEKQDGCRSQPGALGYSSNQVMNIPNSSYYGENSSSSGASPSPTTSATSTTTLSWNTPVVGSPQQMSANIFLTMHQQQQQQQQQDINHVEKVNNSKQTNLHTKAQSKCFGDIVYVESHENQHEHVAHQLDNQIIHASEVGDNTRPEDGFYTFVDGKLTYNIPAAAISSASLINKPPNSSAKIVTPRKQCSVDSQQPSQQQNISQMPSPAYPIYESPSLCSSVGSPPPVVSSMHSTEAANNSGHIIVYKSNTPTQQAQTPMDVSTIACGSSMVNRNNIFPRSGENISSLSPATSVAYSSVITSALQAHQQQQIPQRHQHSQHPNCWLGNNTDKLPNTVKHEQKTYPIQGSPTQEDNLYILPASLQIKRTLLEPVNTNANSPQGSSHHQQQMINNGLHIASPSTVIDKQQSQMQSLQPQQQNSYRKEQAVENILTANTSLASQIQSTKKVEDIQKPNPPKKTPRKRQPKKTLLTNNDYSRTSQQNNVQTQAQVLRQQQQQQQQTIPQHSTQQHQTVQLQQQNGSFYDYNNRWMSQKLENNTDVSTFGNDQQQQQQSNAIPQPAHVQSSQTHNHISQISQYYPAFPQQVSTQYAACMSQNNNLYNLTPLAQEAPHEQQHQQPSTNQAHSLQDQSTSIEAQPQPIAESSTYKVIVPNIEDELDFLSNMDTKSLNHTFQQQKNNYGYNRENTQKHVPEAMSHMYQKNIPVKKVAFMDSYLKFLQGDRDESPPPIIKGGRKFNYQKPTPQTDGSSNIKRKADEVNQSLSTTPTAVENEKSSLNVEPSATNISDNNTISVTADDGHKIKIISQTQILPKKRPQAQNMTTGIQQIQASTQEIPEQSSPHSNQQLHDNVQSQLRQNQTQTQQPNFHQDPLAIPPRREQSLRKAKSRSINEIIQSSNVTTDRDEPEEFADSDADPVWTPQDDENDDARLGKICGKRKHRRGKSSPSTKRKEVHTANELSASTDNDNNKKVTDPKMLPEVNNATGNITSVDNFKTGDFIVLRSDLVNDWPIIWQVDSKCILQKYEPFCQNGKMFYRNMSKYASWNLETKKLYLKAPVRIQIQSHTETIVEFMRSELLADDTEQFIEKIMEDYLTYRDHFEIYIQTMISQVLDPSFLSEINREKDEYFLSSVRTIDDIMENCKRKLLSITPWTRSVIVSIETWPQCHVFTEWGQNNVNQKNCGGCHQPGISVRFLLFGHPYNTSTMQTIPIDMRVAYEKDILLCRICAARADIFHKIAHEKYNLFAICTRRVGDHQREYPGKGSTEILNDLLAENNWVDELFRNMRSSWAEVESLERQKRFHEVSQ